MTHPPQDGTPSTGRWLLVQIALLLVFGALLYQQIRDNQVQTLPELSMAPGERLQCVSYAPYHRGRQSPFIKGFMVSAEQLRRDLEQISHFSACVRLYSVSQGLDQVLPIARELGLKVLLGAWIGRESADNERELLKAVELARTYPDVVRALIVGNEVLLRREQDEAAMRAYIRRAKAQVSVPVTYADVWEFWLKFDGLAQDVDFVTVHILPFWEDEPVAIDDAAEHVATIREKVGQHFAGRRILIGETGWPSAGRQREESEPSLLNEARYFREFINIAHQHGWEYNFIEAIDQPWKRQLEGTVGGYWGVLAADSLTPKFPLGAGPATLAERTDLSRALKLSAIGAALCLLLGLWRKLSAPALISATLLGATCGLILALQEAHMHLAYRNAQEWTALGTLTLLAVLAAPVSVFGRFSTLPAGEVAWATFRNGGLSTATVGSLLRVSLLFGGSLAALLLWVDPRYRDFPVWLYAVPALVYGVLPALRHGLRMPPVGRAELLLAVILVFATVLRWLQEPANPQALGWLLTGCALALSAFGPRTPGAHQHQQ